MKADTLVNTPSVKQWDVIAHLRPPPSHFPGNTVPHSSHSLPSNHSESTRPAPSPSHSLDTSGGEEKQLGREEPSRVQGGGSWRLLGTILGFFQLRDPV